MKIGCSYPTLPAKRIEKNMDCDLPAPDYVESGLTSSCQVCSSPADESNSSITPATKENFESKLPPPRPFSTDLVGMSAKKSRPPTITIPFVPSPATVTATANPARSPYVDSIQVPTPSAPSPVPLALRPRLVIPSSPPMLSHQYSPHLFSPESLNSAHSVKSDLSEISINSSYSNPRPPEDSTPYPQTATPLSGYPRDFEPKWKIHSGEVSTPKGNEPSSPAYSLDEKSPASSWFVWDPTGAPIQTSLSESWFQGTPLGRRPEPFPWNDLTNHLPYDYERAMPAPEEQASGSETPRDSIKMHFQGPVNGSLHTEQ